MVIIKMDVDTSLDKIEELSRVLNSQTSTDDDNIVIIPNYCYVVGQF